VKSVPARELLQIVVASQSAAVSLLLQGHRVTHHPHDAMYFTTRRNDDGTMTTVDKVHNVFLSFKGRSPRQIYLDAASQYKAKLNSAFAESLSDKVDDFWYLEDLDLSNNYFGPKGCMAVLKIVQSQQRLRSLNLNGCGLDENVVMELVEVMQDHPRLRDISLADNPDISIFCGKLFARVVKLNVNIINLDLSNTHVGRNVAQVLHQACERNRKAMEAYFMDDWFRMQDMFLGLDVDGSGWINIKNMVGSVIYPLIQEKLEERIATLKPRRREDNCIDVVTFMELTYLNFKNREEIRKRADEIRDTVYDTIVGNWILLMKEIAAAGAVCTEVGKVQQRDFALTRKQAASIVEKAKEAQKQKNNDEGYEPVEPIDIKAVTMRKAIAECDVPATPSLIKRRQSFLDRLDEKRFALPPSMVRAICALFDGAPPQGLPARTVLDARIETPFETLNVQCLEADFAQYSIAMDMTLTMEEVVNLFDEYYHVVRTPKPLTPELVRKIID
jgi:hypothetical protein